MGRLRPPPGKAVCGDVKAFVFPWIRNHHKTMVKESQPKFLHQDWKKTMRQYDSPNTVFVLDPPWERTCTPAAHSIGWACQKNEIGGLIDDVIETTKHIKGKAIITLDKSDRKRLCKAFPCRTIVHKHGHGGTYRYLIGVKK